MVAESKKYDGEKLRKEGPLYYSKPGAGIQNGVEKDNIAWFSSVTQAFRNCSSFRESVNHGKKNQVTKKLKSLFHGIETKKIVKKSQAKAFASFIRKQAKKSKFDSRYIRQYASFLLKKAGYRPVPHVHTITFHAEKSVTDDGYSQPIKIPHTYTHAYVVTIPITKRTKPQEIKELLLQKREEKKLGKKSLAKFFHEHTLPIGDDLKAYINKAPDKMRFTLMQEVAFKFKSVKNVPKILPICLARWHNGSEKEPEFLATTIIPSMVIDIPLAQSPSKVARFKLASVVVLPVHYYYYAEYFKNLRTYVPRPKKGKHAWLLYDDKNVTELKNHKAKAKNGIDTFVGYNDLVNHGVLYLYDFVGLKKVKTS